MTKQRLTIISLVSILIFGLLMGSKLLYENKWLKGNLIKESEEIPGIVSTEILSYEGKTEMVVRTDQVSDLQDLSSKIKNIAGAHAVPLVDQRSEELEKVYNQMQFAIQEGIVQGNFTQMQEKLEGLAAEAGVEMELSMDNEAIYLILNKGDNQLVSIIERRGQGVFLPSAGSEYTNSQ